MARVLAILAVILVVAVLVGAFVLIAKKIHSNKIAAIARHDPKQLSHDDIDPAIRDLLIQRSKWMEGVAGVLEATLSDPVVQSSLPSEYYQPLEKAVQQYRQMEGN